MSDSLKDQVASLTRSAAGFMDLYNTERDARIVVMKRAEAAERKLARLVERLSKLSVNMTEQAPGLGYQNALEVINRILRDAEATGEGE